MPVSRTNSSVFVVSLTPTIKTKSGVCSAELSLVTPTRLGAHVPNTVFNEPVEASCVRRPLSTSPYSGCRICDPLCRNTSSQKRIIRVISGCAHLRKRNITSTSTSHNNADGFWHLYRDIEVTAGLPVIVIRRECRGDSDQTCLLKRGWSPPPVSLS